jgi:predicted transcriptional regulator
MSFVFYFIVFSGLLQIAMALFIAFIAGDLRDEAQSRPLKFRLKLFEAAFFLYALRTFLHVLSGSGVSDDLSEVSHLPHINLLLGHAFESIVFVLIGTIGLLYFVDNKYHKSIKKASWGTLGILSLIIIYLLTAHALALLGLIAAEPLAHSDNLFVSFHSFQIILIVAVTAIIMKKLIDNRATLNPFRLHEKYPFGFGVIILTLANLIHLHSLILTRSLMITLEITEETLALLALIIISSMMWKTFNKDRFAQETLVESDDLVVSLNNVLKHAYFGYYSLEIGVVDFMFNNLLEKSHLSDVAIEGGIGIDRSRFLKKVSEDPKFLLHVATGLLDYFEKNKQMLDKEQLDFLIDYLAISVARHKYDVSTLRSLWITLSNIMKTTEIVGSSKLMKLSGWNPASNFAYFENTHPTGLSNLDRITGGIVSKSFVLNLRNAEISKESLFYPFIGINLSHWRTIIYVTPDELSDVVSKLKLEKYLDEGRITLVGLTHGKQKDGLGKGLYHIEESTKALLSLLEELISEHPHRAIIFVIDLNPFIIREKPEDLHLLIRALKKIILKGNISIYSTATDKMDSIKLDLIEDNSNLVIRHEIEEGNIISILAKTEFRKKPLALRQELGDILVFVEKENTSGRKVNITGIMKYIGITAVTVRKRIKELLDEDLLEVDKVGRTKFLSVSNKGKEFLYSRENRK